MNMKKLWIFAMVFGLIAAGILSVMLKGQPTQSAEPVKTEPLEEEDKVEAEVDILEDDEAIPNEMLPFENGNRAITIAVNDEQGVAGFVNPGSFVDIVTVMTVPEEYKNKQHDAATLLLQNVKVLAIGHAEDDVATRKRYQMITVEVTPYEGLALGFATKHDLYLLLRNEGDDKLEAKRTHVHEDELHEGVFKK